MMDGSYRFHCESRMTASLRSRKTRHVSSEVHDLCGEYAQVVQDFLPRAQPGTASLEVATQGVKGFDSEEATETIVLAAPVRHEQLANPNRERQRRGSASGCGLSGVNAVGAQVAHWRKHMSWTLGNRRPGVETKTVVEAPTPRRQWQPVAMNPAMHASEFLFEDLEDSSSILDTSTAVPEPTLQRSRGGILSERARHGDWGEPSTRAELRHETAGLRSFPESA
jgi:hypothetical protein